MSLTSQDVLGERLARLRELFPEAWSEDHLDTEKLAQLIGQSPAPKTERYGLSWAGKAEAHRVVQSLSTGTLRPAPDESVNFDTTGNLIIEGDNLEVLKLLQKSYVRRVKMIYIDPPYNTGNEFIYPDNFREGLQTYLEYSGQVKSGVRQSTNAETNGRYHSNWLNMMYPRLFLARNLLKDDGVIFVSIDDHEVHNLRLMMNEIFGEENFIAQIIWQKRTSPDARLLLGAAHDYIVAFSRDVNSEEKLRLLPIDTTRRAEFKNPDNDPRGDWASVDLTGQMGHATPSQYYTITTPSGLKYEPPQGRCWALAKASFEKLLEDKRIWFGKENSGRPRLKKFLSETTGVTAWTWWTNSEVGHNQEATKELNDLMLNSGTFDTPKPTRLIKRILQLSTSSDDIILDFFAGSGTTAQAVLELNAEDSGNRRFILVQLPEPTSNIEYSNIAEITKERVRRVISKMNAADNGTLPIGDGAAQDRGFKVFKLDSSNFKVWDGHTTPTDAAALAAQLQLYAEHRIPDRSAQDVLFELLLKSGRSLAASVEERNINNQTVYVVEGGELLIYLEEPIQEATLEAMISLAPQQVICLDAAFEGNDPLKNNIVLQMKDAGISFRTV